MTSSIGSVINVDERHLNMKILTLENDDAVLLLE